MSWNDISFYYADHYEVALEANHRFPMSKYKKLRKSLVDQGIIHSEQCTPADPIDEELLLLAHKPQYVHSVLNLTLNPRLARAIGLPLNAQMVNRTRASAMAFTQAVDQALIYGYGASFAGGTHHAHYDRGEGFCFFNDFAINVRRLYQAFPQKKILILDLDVHQGNGNSSILKDDPNVFIVSFHGSHNYPYRKVASHIDVEFPNNTGDDLYLKELNRVLKQCELMNFDVIFYQAGVDALAQDSFGKLSMTHEGLRRRDEMVFNYAFKNKIPLASAIGGGYAKDIDESVTAYVNTFKVAKQLYSDFLIR